MKVNTEEQGPGKFHCPLSGKKFKGPEFVKKHIFNKHAEKVENVKKDVSRIVPCGLFVPVSRIVRCIVRSR